MIFIVSPSKTMDFENSLLKTNITFKEKTSQLINEISNFSNDDIAKVMKIKGKLLDNVTKIYENFDIASHKEAITSYNGAVFKEIKVNEYSKLEKQYLSNNLVILSALYGDISPFDFIKEYRMDMTMKILKNSTLYKFWSETISRNLEKRLEKTSETTLINLASNEFSKLIDRKTFKYSIIDIDFKEKKDDKYKSVSTYSKKARGLMIHYLITHNVNSENKIKEFNSDGYSFNVELSSETKYIFTR